MKLTHSMEWKIVRFFNSFKHIYQNYHKLKMYFAQVFWALCENLCFFIAFPRIFDLFPRKCYKKYLFDLLGFQAQNLPGASFSVLSSKTDNRLTFTIWIQSMMLMTIQIIWIKKPYFPESICRGGCSNTLQVPRIK